MPEAFPASARAIVSSGRIAHVATVDPERGAHVTLAWVGIDGDEVVFATLSDQRKLHNIRRDPRVTISIATEDRNEHGLDVYLVLYGRARVTEGGAPELLQQLAYTYIGPGVVFPPMPDPPAGFVTRVGVERCAGIGPWASR